LPRKILNAEQFAAGFSIPCPQCYSAGCGTCNDGKLICKNIHPEDATSQQAWDAISLWNCYQNGVLLDEGGWGDQQENYIFIMRWIDFLHGEIARKASEELKKKEMLAKSQTARTR
jgi:hypothetical protein